MNLVDLHIIQTFQYIASKKRKGYSESSQLKILSFLKKYYDTSICRRTLNYHLRSLEDNIYIRRIRRHKRGPTGKILFHTTVNLLKIKALKFLANFRWWFKKVGWALATPAQVEKKFNYTEWSARANEGIKSWVYKPP